MGFLRRPNQTGEASQHRQDAKSAEQSQRWLVLEMHHTQLKRQFRDSKLREQNAVRRLNKIQKDLKNVESDNLDLQLLLANLLQRRLLLQAPDGR